MKKSLRVPSSIEYTGRIFFNEDTGSFEHEGLHGVEEHDIINTLLHVAGADDAIVARVARWAARARGRWEVERQDELDAHMDAKEAEADDGLVWGDAQGERPPLKPRHYIASGYVDTPDGDVLHFTASGEAGKADLITNLEKKIEYVDTDDAVWVNYPIEHLKRAELDALWARADELLGSTIQRKPL